MVAGSRDRAQREQEEGTASEAGATRVVLVSGLNYRAQREPEEGAARETGASRGILGPCADLGKRSAHRRRAPQRGQCSKEPGFLWGL